MSALLVVFVYSAFLYLFVIAALRVFGRRFAGEFNQIDLLILLLIGSAVETGLVHRDTSLPAGIVSVAALVLADRSINVLLRRFPKLRLLVFPAPLVLIADGKLIAANLERSGLTRRELHAALRQHECFRVSEVRYAVMELQGEVTVVRRQ